MKYLPDADFRSRRYVLEPDEWGLPSEEPEGPPTDLVAETIWKHIISLTDETAIFTTSHFGRTLAALSELSTDWIMNVVDMDRAPFVFPAMLDAASDLDASTFNLISGYYRQAIAALRGALEIVMLATVCRLYTDHPVSARAWGVTPHTKFANWGKKYRQDNFGWLRRQLEAWAEGAPVPYRAPTAYDLADEAQKLFTVLSLHVHVRVRRKKRVMVTVSSEQWGGSTGPIFHMSSFRRCVRLQLRTYLVLYRLIKLARPHSFRAAKVLSVALGARTRAGRRS